MYTDGITEAENNAGAAFEDSGLEGVIATVWTSDSQQVGRSILEAVERYAQDVRLADDLTALVLKRAPVPV
jgi:serine phosphatase RsbU (regulator of sigma subunit)